MSAVELLNWSSFCVNWVIDEKAQSGLYDKRRDTLAIEGFFNDALNLVLNDTNYIKKILEINERILKGFQAEEQLSIQNNSMLNDFSYFWKYYQTRNIEAVGQFFGNCSSLAKIYSNGDSELEKKLKNILTDFGEGIEILNDLSDFIITQKAISSEKNIGDQFSDLRTGTVTWPIWIIYNNANQDDKDFLHSLYRKKVTSNDAKKVLYLLYSTDAYKETRSFLKNLSKHLKKDLKKLDINPRIKGLLECMITIFKTNRFYHKLDELERDLLK